jgi:hypothetical protein
MIPLGSGYSIRSRDIVPQMHAKMRVKRTSAKGARTSRPQVEQGWLTRM